MVTMKVLFSLDVLESNDSAALDRLASGACLFVGALHRPIAIHIFLDISAGDGLLTTARTVFDVMRVKSDVVVGVHQFDDRAAGHQLVVLGALAQLVQGQDQRHHRTPVVEHIHCLLVLICDTSDSEDQLKVSVLTASRFELWIRFRGTKPTLNRRGL